MSDKLCDLCQNKDGKYVCPTCNVFYCSVVCFRSQQHLQCSELFYKKCVEEELRCRQFSSPSKITSVLKRTEHNFSNEVLEDLIFKPVSDGEDEDKDEDEDEDDNEKSDDGDENEDGERDSDDDDDNDDIAKRMENVDLNNHDELWEKLTLKERKEFKALVSNGNIRKILPEWVPWWTFYKPKLIVDIESEDENNSEEYNCPSADILITPFSEITKKTPSENISFMMANILMSYAYTTRWFKGKHCDMPVEGVTTLIALSAVLRSNKVFQSFLEAYAEFENDLKNCKWLTQDLISRELIWEDVADIVQGSKEQDMYFSLKACICDIHDILGKASNVLRDAKGLKRFTAPEPTHLQIKLLSKRTLYYLSWISTYGGQLKSKLKEGCM